MKKKKFLQFIIYAAFNSFGYFFFNINLFLLHNTYKRYKILFWKFWCKYFSLLHTIIYYYFIQYNYRPIQFKRCKRLRFRIGNGTIYLRVTLLFYPDTLNFKCLVHFKKNLKIEKKIAYLNIFCFFNVIY